MSSKLTKIILENFQSIEDRHELEMGGINILVGPNSSGKSAIFDVLTFFSKCLIPETTHSFIKPVGRKHSKLIKIDLKRDYESSTKFLRNGAKEACIGLEFNLNSSPGEYEQNISPRSGGAYDLILKEKLTTPNLIYKVTFLLNFKKEKLNWYIHSFDLLFSNQKFLEFKCETDTDNFKIYQNKNTIFDFSKENLRVFSGDNYKCNLKRGASYGRATLKQNNFSDLEFSEDKDFLSTFFGIINICVEQTYNKLGVNYGPGWVQASRQIPKPDECVFLVDEIQGYDADFIDSIPIKNINESQHFNFIANSFAMKDYYQRGQDFINDQVFFDYCKCLDKNYGKNLYYSITARLEIEDEDGSYEGKDLSEDIKFCPLCGKKLEQDDSNICKVSYPFFGNEDTEWEVSHADRINYYLANDLLVDNGYQIDADVDYIVNSYQLYNDDIYDTKPVIPIVRLYLRNAKGEELEFEDVGSGVAYMLPVLAAACVRDGLVMIQQPELHIHPALQSAFANVFTDNFENPYFSNDTDKVNNNFPEIQFLLETHSEHLILRFLKLIKNSKNRTDSHRQISADDLSIFYFEPNPIKNSTSIKKIRITEDGGFLDRWPNGFFTERFKDIFDE